MPQLGLGLGLHRANRALFRGLLDQYAGAAAAYSLRALSSGWLAGDVVEVRPSHGAAAQSFTESQITSGAMLSFVNGGTTDLYNSARYFNGTSTYVSHDTGSTSATFFANKTISAKFILGSTAVQAIHVRGAIAERLYVTGGGNFGVGGSTDTGFSVSAGVLYHTELDIDATGKIVELRVNGNTEWTGSITELVSTSTFYIGARDAGGLGLFLNGTVYDVSITSYLAYTGLGTSVTAWEDTIGSNDGTETNGAAYTGQPFDGFVSKWYDQSGNGNDAIQITTTAQPKIVDAGALVTGGLDFDNVDDYLDSINTISFGTGPRSIFATCAPDSITANADGIVQLNIQTVSNGEGWLLTPELATRTNAVTWISSTPATLSQNNLISNIYTSGNLHAGNSMFLNGASVSRTSGTDGVINTSTSEVRIGNGVGANTPFNGAIRELIIYQSDQSANRAAIEANINAAYSIYA